MRIFQEQAWLQKYTRIFQEQVCLQKYTRILQEQAELHSRRGLIISLIDLRIVISLALFWATCSVDNQKTFETQ